MSLTTIAVVNNKGGVGKTFNAINLAFKLKDKGPCIAIDNDSQGNMSLMFAVPEVKAKNTTASIYSRECYISAFPATVRVSLGGEDREIVDNLFISTASEELANSQRSAPATSMFNLASAVSKAGDEYKYCVVDCPPGAGIAQDMALFAADYILIPMSPDTYSLDGVKSLIGAINKVIEHRRTVPKVRMFLNATDYNSRVMAAEIKGAMRSMYQDYMSTVEVPFQQAFCNGSSYLFPITVYSRIKRQKSKASAALDVLIQELGLR